MKNFGASQAWRIVVCIVLQSYVEFTNFKIFLRALHPSLCLGCQTKPYNDLIRLWCQSHRGLCGVLPAPSRSNAPGPQILEHHLESGSELEAVSADTVKAISELISLVLVIP